jgi:putative ABC transport system substrate-binding protein
MQRRSVLSVALGATLCPALPAIAQTQRVARVGMLANVPNFDQGFYKWLQKRIELHGWEVGQNLDIEYRFGMNEVPRFLALAKELVAARMDVILALGDDSVEAAFKATRSIPIVMVGSSAVELGYAKSLARPDGNVTGVVTQALDFVGKSLGLLRALRPDLQRIGVSHRPGHALSELWLSRWKIAADSNRIAIVALPFVRDLVGIEPMLVAATASGVHALVGEGPVPVLLGPGFEKINAWAIQHKVLTLTATWIRGEHLVSYGPEPWALRYTAVAHVDRILRGARAADMPIEQPTRFDLILNRKIARAMGLTIPASVLLQANEVID